MPTPPTSFRAVYTAPGSSTSNNDEITIPFGSTTTLFNAASGTYIYAYHPADHTLRIDSPSWVTTTTSQYLSFTLPEGETDTTFVLIAETTGTAATIKVTTKKEGTKPEPVRKVAFGV